MSLNCEPGFLANAAKCFNGISPILLKAMRLRLLCAYINGEAMTCDPNTLSIAAKCFAALDTGTLDAIETYLVCQVATSSSGQILQGTIDPVNPPSNANSPAIYSNLSTGVLWTWNATSKGWV